MSEYINNSQKRKEQLKALIKELHAGGDLEDIRKRFAALVGNVSAVEIAHMEQELISEGLPVEEVKKLCDVHVQVFQGAITSETRPELVPGHPVHTFKYENFALGEVISLLDEAIAALPDADALGRARAFAGQLAEVNKVYLRKENLLFPILEKHGIVGPSSVMWATHDDIRAQLKAFRQALQGGDAAQIKQLWGPLSNAIKQMFYKEENILYPTALKMLSEAEWMAIRDQSDEIGYALIRPGDQWKPTVAAAELPKPAGYAQEETAPAAGGLLPLDTGALTPQQVNLLLNHLPVDVTFVDEQDTVRYFSQGRGERIFVRSPAIIGRKVQNCHPPKSVHVVNRILDDFRAGKRDQATFWIQMGNKFVYILYVAVRDRAGQYRGTLEVTQDIAPLRKLEGERRLLEETGVG